MKRSCIALVIVPVMMLPAPRLFADPSLRARPAPHCRSFFITEVGYSYRVTPPMMRETFTTVAGSIVSSSSYPVSGRHLLTSELGVMYNINPSYALGFTHSFGWDVEHNLYGGLKVRGRKWLSQTASIDVSAGAALWGTSGSFEYPAFIGAANLGFTSGQGVDLTITSMSTPPSAYAYPDYSGTLVGSVARKQHELGVHLGYRLGAKPGLVVHGAALVTLGVAFAVFFATYDGN